MRSVEAILAPVPVDGWRSEDRMTPAADVELTDEELERVVGGLSRVPLDLWTGGEEAGGPSDPSLRAPDGR